MAKVILYEVFGRRIVYIVKLCTVLYNSVSWTGISGITLFVTSKPIVIVKCLFSVCDGYIDVREVVHDNVCVALQI